MIVRNSIANLAGSIIPSILSVIFVPIYIRYLGLEGYGLVGFFSILVALLGILTNGLGSALQREIARRDSSKESHQTLRQLVYSFELAYWAMGVIIALCMLSFSGKISTDWVKIESMPVETVRLCIMIVSVRIALIFPISIYQSVFIGTQKQVLNNIIKLINTISNSLSGVIVVIIWRSILGFYMVDLFNTIWAIFLMRYLAGKVLPQKSNNLANNFQFYELKNLFSLSLGLIWTNGIGVIVTQTDRIIISKLLPMAILGVYNVAIMGSMPLNIICNSIFIAIYPNMCKLSKKDCRKDLSFQLIYVAKIVMIICMMFGLPVLFFSSDLIEIWTKNDALVTQGSNVMGLYILGTIFASYSSVLYLGQMAQGISRFGILYNTAALLWFPLVEWLLVDNFGLIGATFGWIIYNTIGWMFHVLCTRSVLGGEFPINNYLRLIIYTFVTGIVINIFSRYLAILYFGESVIGRILIASIGGIITLLVCYVICFGFQLSKEFQNYYLRLGERY